MHSMLSGLNLVPVQGVGIADSTNTPSCFSAVPAQLSLLRGAVRISCSLVGFELLNDLSVLFAVLKKKKKKNWLLEVRLKKPFKMFVLARQVSGN